MDALALLKPVLAFTPALALLSALARFDAFKLVRLSTVVLLLGAGAALAAAGLAANGGLMDRLPYDLAAYSRYVAPLVEETLKAALIVALFDANRIGFKLDSAVIGFAVGAGFSIFENGWFLHLFPDANIGLWLVRGFGTAIMHGGATALFAVVSHEFTETQAQARAAHYRFRPWLYLPGLGGATLLHSGFNHLEGAPLLQMAAAAVVVPLSLMAVYSMGHGASHRWVRSDHDRHRRLLDEIRSGRFAESEQGRAIRAICNRFDAELAPLAVEYVRLQTEVALAAEQLLLAEAADAQAARAEDVAGILARLVALEQALGRAAMAAVREHAPLTRNDRWEIAHLQEAAAASE